MEELKKRLILIIGCGVIVSFIIGGTIAVLLMPIPVPQAEFTITIGKVASYTYQTEFDITTVRFIDGFEISSTGRYGFDVGKIYNITKVYVGDTGRIISINEVD